MQYQAEQLSDRLPALRSPLLLCGDETLLLEETLDRIREQLLQQQFVERETRHIDNDKKFDFDAAMDQSSSLSLFSSRKVIEWRFLHSPGDAGRPALMEMTTRVGADTFFIAVMPGLQKKQMEAKWCAAFFEHGSIIRADSIPVARLTDFLSKRALQMGLQVSSAALRVLTDYTEGNLLASQQSLKHLHLLYGSQPVDEDAMLDVLVAQARFDVYAVGDAALSADAQRVTRMLAGLRAEDENFIRQLVPAVQRDLRSLALVLNDIEQGLSPEQAVKNAKIFFKREKFFIGAARRCRMRTVQALMRGAFDAERMMKGALTGDVWQQVEQVLLWLARRETARSGGN